VGQKVPIIGMLKATDAMRRRCHAQEMPPCEQLLSDEYDSSDRQNQPQPVTPIMNLPENHYGRRRARKLFPIGDREGVEKGVDLARASNS